MLGSIIFQLLTLFKTGYDTPFKERKKKCVENINPPHPFAPVSWRNWSHEGIKIISLYVFLFLDIKSNLEHYCLIERS